MVVKFGVVEFERSDEELRKERDHWDETKVGGESWGQEIGG